ncbi:sugar ABC transporter substrate-binding protein [Fodinicola acaciae]|uniref:sugar ABC transporter substrate-binding protein n=1 Tax=Fodinicola acaciae TaxID=2681555 RepID=UPI0013CF9EA9|nr:sugar ABC transporter substrate-binding protein [Fodinicola acaciae]
MHRSRLVVVALAAMLVVAGCSSSGGKQQEQGAGGVGAGKANTPPLKIAFVTHSAQGDTFWDVVRKGAQAAAAKDNVTLLYSSDASAPNQATLVQNAIDQKVDGIAVTLATPAAMQEVVGKAVAAKIPVVGLNAGIADWKRFGMLEYFGQDESVAGQAFGSKLAGLGAKHVLCVIHAQGQVQLEDRCAGLKKTLTSGTAENLYVNGADLPSVQSTITGKLQQDKSIDYVVTLGAQFATTAVTSVKNAGSKAKIATFDLNNELIAAIKSGSIQFCVDQQPYLQGYLAVDALWLYKVNGNVTGGGQAVLTGPTFVDKSNVDQVSKFATAGTR